MTDTTTSPGVYCAKVWDIGNLCARRPSAWRSAPMTRILLAIAAAVAMAACGDSGTSPSAVTEAALTTEHFTGTLGVGALRSYAFTAPSDSAVTVLLGSLSSSTAPALPAQTVGLGMGVPAGTGCAVREEVVTTPTLTSQFTSWAPEGIHCIAVYDVGTLTEDVSFAIRISHY
ncbi:MAG: hypothetical protein R2712_04645 [Vicinamibacterales bacterium]